MCTAIRFNERYFGRTLDFERSFGESLVVTPREKMPILDAQNRYAMMGIGVTTGGIPLYFDGVNEWGLAAAALNFPRLAVYRSADSASTGVPSGCLVSHILGLCRSVSEAKEMLGKISITDESADGCSKRSPLHWIIADGRESAVIESVSEGLHVYDNPTGVLTNAPEFNYQLTRLADYSSLSARNPVSTIGGTSLYSRGIGGIGLPGDYSSSSRFVRASFLKECSFGKTSTEGVSEISRAFSLLSSVAIPLGAVVSDEGLPVFTMYTAVIDLESPSYYLTTAPCRTILTAKLNDSICNGKGIQSYPIYRKECFSSLTER